MSVFALKLIGIVTMLIDHIGFVFFADVALYSIIGRLSFPIFAWLVANGYRHTKNKKLYMARLAILALVSEIPFQLVMSTGSLGTLTHNIAASLLFGLVGIHVFEITENRGLRVVFTGAFALLAGVLFLDYGVYGFLTMLLFHVYFKDVKKAALIQVVLLGIAYLLPAALFSNTEFLHQTFAIFAFYFIARHNGKLGRPSKYFFYVFYPLHLLVLYTIHVFLTAV